MEYFTGTVSNGNNTFNLTNQEVPSYIMQVANLNNYTGAVDGVYSFDGEEWTVHGTLSLR